MEPDLHLGRLGDGEGPVKRCGLHPAIGRVEIPGVPGVDPPAALLVVGLEGLELVDPADELRWLRGRRCRRRWGRCGRRCWGRGRRWWRRRRRGGRHGRGRGGRNGGRNGGRDHGRQRWQGSWRDDRWRVHKRNAAGALGRACAGAEGQQTADRQHGRGAQVTGAVERGAGGVFGATDVLMTSSVREHDGGDQGEEGCLRVVLAPPADTQCHPGAEPRVVDAGHDPERLRHPCIDDRIFIANCAAASWWCPPRAGRQPGVAASDHDRCPIGAVLVCVGCSGDHRRHGAGDRRRRRRTERRHLGRGLARGVGRPGRGVHRRRQRVRHRGPHGRGLRGVGRWGVRPLDRRRRVLPDSGRSRLRRRVRRPRRVARPRRLSGVLRPAGRARGRDVLRRPHRRRARVRARLARRVST